MAEPQAAVILCRRAPCPQNNGYAVKKQNAQRNQIQHRQQNHAAVHFKRVKICTVIVEDCYAVEFLSQHGTENANQHIDKDQTDNAKLPERVFQAEFSVEQFLNIIKTPVIYPLTGLKAILHRLASKFCKLFRVSSSGR